MFYIVPEWYVDQKNAELVYSILEKYLGSDLNPDSKNAIKELKALGEVIIIEKLKHGFFNQ